MEGEASLDGAQIARWADFVDLRLRHPERLGRERERDRRGAGLELDHLDVGGMAGEERLARNALTDCKLILPVGLLWATHWFGAVSASGTPGFPAAFTSSRRSRHDHTIDRALLERTVGRSGIGQRRRVDGGTRSPLDNARNS